ncbi:MAG: tetraacyldisaccharide 4'-kinase [Betaproteobacteria bacterium]|nr:tetraacyldisaccharide 4'-kinase [Betaproteobacteria bacterium]
MQAWLEREWQRLGGGALVFLPLALVFRLLVALRRALYGAGILRAWKSPVPVIVVGNITAGGTGKTPLVIAVVESLRRAGRNPGVISRGYGRVPPTDADPRGVVRVLPGIATPEYFGDEPVLIARRTGAPVYLSPDRPAAARALLAAHPEIDVLVSDDGLQHYALARDVEIAVVDGERGFGNGLPLPSGPLREPVSRLRSVDAAVVNGGYSDLVPAPRQFAMTLAGERFVSFANEDLSPAQFALGARGRRVAAVAGIGNPARFFSHLARLGVAGERHAFADHHHFQQNELRLPGVELIVMTEKDAVKCAAFADARMWFLRVEAVLPPEFDAFLLDRLAAGTRP